MLIVNNNYFKLTIQVLFVTLLTIHNSHQEWNTKDFLRKEHSLSKPYGGSGFGIPYFEFLGSTVVSNKYVRLTADSQSLKGALWNTIPVSMTDWEMQVQFKVQGQGRDLFGDGFAIWYARDAKQIGDVFGSKDLFHGLGIILDTYSNNNGAHNHQTPYISAMINNGTLHYDHEKDGINTELAGCEANFRNKDHDTYIAIRYHNYKLTVSHDIHNKNAWKECFSVDNVKLPTLYYFGFSAATGDLSDNHDIISVKVYQLESERANERIDHSRIEPHADFSVKTTVTNNSSGWGFLKVFFIVIVVIIAVLVVGVVGYIILIKQRQNKKRFY